jgi:hypothetical protein
MKRDSNQINSFFIEIIIVILFFSISAAVTLQLFVAANNRAQQSSDLSVAVIKAQDIAEQIKGISSLNELTEELKAAKYTSSGGTEHFLLDYDKQWNQTQSAPQYKIDIALTKDAVESGVLVHADILVSRCKSSGENQIFTLNTAKYLSKTP